MTFEERVRSVRPEPLSAVGVEILQVNLGCRCNMTCKHCHVGGGPVRGEMMDPDTLETVLAALSEQEIGTVDITGGAPELNPNFRRLVIESRKMGRRVIMRINLTVFFEDGMDYLPRFYDEHSV